MWNKPLVLLSTVLFSNALGFSHGEWDMNVDDFDISGLRELFEVFVDVYEKIYTDSLYYEERLDIFISNYKHMKRINDSNLGFRVSINIFSDLNKKDLEAMFKNRLVTGPDNIIYQSIDLSPSIPTLPSTIDWRHTQCLGPVKNQGSCSSCWAFTATAALEALHCVHLARQRGEIVDHVPSLLSREEETGERESSVRSSHVSFSEQFLIDCDKAPHNTTSVSGAPPPPNQEISERNWACMGGFTGYALDFLRTEGLDFPSTVYPYRGAGTSCKSKTFSSSAVPLEWAGKLQVVQAPRSVEGMRRALAVSPVAVSICSTPTEVVAYKSGVLRDEGNLLCGGESGVVTDHAVLIIGYGEELNEASGEVEGYYVFRNSWGEDWGEEGYGRIRARDLPEDDPTEWGDFGWARRAIMWVDPDSLSDHVLRA